MYILMCIALLGVARRVLVVYCVSALVSVLKGENRCIISDLHHGFSLGHTLSIKI